MFLSKENTYQQIRALTQSAYSAQLNNFTNIFVLGIFTNSYRIPRIILNPWILSQLTTTASIEIGGCHSFKGNACQSRATNGFRIKNPKSNSCLWPAMSEVDCGESIPSNNLANCHVVLKTGLPLSRAVAFVVEPAHWQDVPFSLCCLLWASSVEGTHAWSIQRGSE